MAIWWENYFAGDLNRSSPRKSGALDPEIQSIKIIITVNTICYKGFNNHATGDLNNCKGGKIYVFKNPAWSYRMGLI